MAAPVPTTGIVAPAILQSLPDVVVVADADGRIVYTNPAVRTLLGHEPVELRGAPLATLVPERFRAAHAAGFDRFVTTGTGKLFAATLQLPALHRNGTEVLVELTLSPLDGPDELGGGGRASSVAWWSPSSAMPAPPSVWSGSSRWAAT